MSHRRSVRATKAQHEHCIKNEAIRGQQVGYRECAPLRCELLGRVVQLFLTRQWADAVVFHNHQLRTVRSNAVGGVRLWVHGDETWEPLVDVIGCAVGLVGVHVLLG